MEKNRRLLSFGSTSLPLKCLLLVKFNVILFCIFSLQSFADINAQDNISLSLHNVEITKVFKAIEDQGKYRFVYKNEIIPTNNHVSIEVKNATLEDVMEIVLQKTSLTFKKVNTNLVVISAVPSEDKSTAPFALSISGKVTNENGEPLIGATIEEKGTSNKTVTKK